MQMILHWLVSTVAVMATAYLLPGVTLDGIFVALVVAVVLGLINAVLRPIALILTLPINILSLGLFTLVLDAALILLTAKIVPGFSVASFWWALGFAVVLALVNSILHGSHRA